MDKSFKELLIVLGQRIKIHRERQGYTLKQFSTITGIRHQYLKKIEDGKAVGMSTTHLLDIAYALKISPHDLVKGW